MLQVPHTTDDTPTAHQATATRRRQTSQLHITPNRERALTPLLATARRIAKLLHDMQDEELVDSFQARYDGRVLRWEDFYLDLADPVEYRRRALTLRRVAKSVLGWPVAVAGIVAKHGTAHGGQQYLELKLERPIKSPDLGWVHVRVISSTLDFAGYQDGQQVLAYGLWNLYGATGTRGNEWVSLWTNEPSAICTIKG